MNWARLCFLLTCLCSLTLLCLCRSHRSLRYSLLHAHVCFSWIFPALVSPWWCIHMLVSIVAIAVQVFLITFLELMSRISTFRLCRIFSATLLTGVNYPGHARFRSHFFLSWIHQLINGHECTDRGPVLLVPPSPWTPFPRPSVLLSW